MKRERVFIDSERSSYHKLSSLSLSPSLLSLSLSLSPLRQLHFLSISGGADFLLCPKHFGFLDVFQVLPHLKTAGPFSLISGESHESVK